MAKQGKEVVNKIKLQCPAGAATPAPPVGPALGQAQVPVGEFVKRFNDATQAQKGIVVPVEIYVYSDRSFDFVVKSPPAAALLKKAAGIDAGSGIPNKNKVGKVNQKALMDIAVMKKADLNARSTEQAAKIIAGTARSMGIDVID